MEYVDHLHEHFVEPCVIRDAAYMPPKAPGFSITMKPESLKTYEFKPNSSITHSSKCDPRRRAPSM